MMILAGGFLALTGILLDSMSRMMNQFMNNSQNSSISKSTGQVDFNKFKEMNIKSK
jgi:hypothetical protein